MASESSRPKPLPVRPPALRRTEAAPKFIEREHMDEAWLAVRKHLHRTPLVKVPMLSSMTGDGAVYAKLEGRQIMGSFKTRGALVRLARRDVRRQGVVTSSAGNHGLGVGWAAQQLGVSATVVLPMNVPDNKRLRIEELVPTVIAPYDGYDETERYARALAHSNDAVFVSPFDDPWVAAANGATLAKEIFDEQPSCDALIFPIGGGGLCAGICRYVEEYVPSHVALIGVQTESNAAMKASFEANRALVTFPLQPTLAEGLEGGVAPRTYQIARRLLSDLITVSEESIGRAMALLFQEMGEVVEGSAAVTVAAFLEHKISSLYRAPVVVLTGRNVGSAVLDTQLDTYLGPAKRIR